MKLRRTRTNRTILIAVILIALAVLAGRALFSEEKSYATAADDGAARAAYGEARAARAEIDRLEARIDELDLRLKVAESRTGYTALDGTQLPPAYDPLATPRPARGDGARR